LRIEAYPALRLADLYCGSERRGVGFGVGVGVGVGITICLTCQIFS
jgi:hypothetical protein